MKINFDEKIQLRDVIEDDLGIFFDHQVDPAANQMAAFTRKNPGDREAFNIHWAKIRADENIRIQTILFESQVAGHIASFGPASEKEVTYWIGREYWGKGIATIALSRFLEQIRLRPLYAHAAKDNVASIRVLEKCGFVIFGQDKFFANARGQEIDELILKLN